MLKQRPTPEPDSFESQDLLWRPELPLEPQPDDRYVVVDERLEGRLTLAVDRWPRVDKGGRLLFEGKTERVPAVETELYEAVRAARQDHGQPAPGREIRIGDTCLVRGWAKDGPSSWGDIFDVTPQAREAAKAAFYGAVAPVMPQEEEIDEEEGDEGPPAAGAVARPAV